jgi:hypothetical protein
MKGKEQNICKREKRMARNGREDWRITEWEEYIIF